MAASRRRALPRWIFVISNRRRRGSRVREEKIYFLISASISRFSREFRGNVVQLINSRSPRVRRGKRRNLRRRNLRREEEKERKKKEKNRGITDNRVFKAGFIFSKPEIYSVYIRHRGLVYALHLVMPLYLFHGIAGERDRTVLATFI